MPSSWLRGLHARAVRTGFALRYRNSLLIRRVQELESSQWWPQEELLALQWRKLQALLQHAYAHVPYYRRAMDGLGVVPQDIRNPQDYARLPVLTKEDMAAHREELIPEGYPRKGLVRTASGGSTGAPVALYHDPEMIAGYRAVKLRNFKWAGWEPGDAWVRLWGSDFDLAPHRTLLGSVFDKLTRRLVLSAWDLTEVTMLRYAQALRRFQPDVIEAYVTPLHLFAQFLEVHGIADIRPRGIICSSEMLYPHQRELIQQVFHCKVYNRYGGREMGDIAHECEAGSLHLNVENLYVEFLRGDRPAAAQESGEIILTALDLYGMPLLRYQVEDVGSPSDQACPCGRGLPTMHMVEGRVQEFVTLPSHRYLPGIFFTHLFKDFPIRRFQVVQESLARLVIRIVRGPGLTEEHVAYLEGKVRDYTHNEIAVETEYVEDIPLTPSGKYRHIVSKVPLRLGSASEASHA